MKQCVKCKRILPKDINHFVKRKRGKGGFNSQCKECTGSKFKPYVKEGYKICSTCKRELPLDEHHFMKQSDCKSGFRSQCKECLGYKFTKAKPIAKEGYKICTKCGRELKSTKEYFFEAKDCKYGLMARCKECEGSRFTPKARKGFKICIKCEKELPANNDYFYSRTSNKDKLYAACKVCNDGSFAWEYKICTKCGAILPKTTNYFSVVSNRNATCKFCQELYQRRYSKTPKGKLQRLIIRNKRATRNKKIIATLTKKQWEECLKFFDYKDAYTGLSMRIISQDHIIPLSKGGGYVKQNILPCEKSVNSSKNNSDMEEWYKKQDFFSEKRLQKIYKWMGIKNNTQQLSII